MSQLVRPSGRPFDQMREIVLETEVTRYAEGSCLAKFGHTHVLCTASWESKVPGWMRGSGKGWVTGEYGMLPRATHTRGSREAARGKQSGRTQEIQRLIGRSLRSVVDLEKLGENQITVDCDVIQADGGTRTASITGGFVALALALKYLRSEGVIEQDPIIKQAAAISVGLWKGSPVLDVDYPEDSGGEADMNVVMSSDGGFIEVQGTGEERPMTRDELNEMMRLAEKGCGELFEAQRSAIG
jgi:ribonuclease PH